MLSFCIQVVLALRSGTGPLCSAAMEEAFSSRDLLTVCRYTIYLDVHKQMMPKMDNSDIFLKFQFSVSQKKVETALRAAGTAVTAVLGPPKAPFWATFCGERP